MKKVLKLTSVLTFVFLLGFGILIGNGNVKAAAAKKQVTIHVKDSVNWGAVNVYTYDGDGELAGEWPGKAMNLKDGWYNYTFTTSSELNLVFNHDKDGDGKADEQTNNVEHVKNTQSEYWVEITPGDGKKNELGAEIKFLATLSKTDPVASTVTKVNKPSKVTVKQMKKNGKKYLSVTYKAVKNANGYEVYVRSNHNKSFKLVRTIKNGKTTTCKIKLEKQKKVTVKIRAFQKDHNKKVFSKFSSNKKVTIK
ncbi:hypothetical protein lbkm_1895 [Lachnospiraceae bacterium KM106-2]|nr:hypothetical protein lbkm_1895 [Lachnospiraceae bacterium KM106-2]